MATSTLGSGTLVLAGTTSGTTTVTATAVAGTTTLTLPAATDTLVGKATTDTLTNKTLTSPTITGGALNGTLGATTPSTGAFTTLDATGDISTTSTGRLNLRGSATSVNNDLQIDNSDTLVNFRGSRSNAVTKGYVWYLNNSTTEGMRIDSSGNLGLGVTPSAWNTGGKAIEIKNGGNALYSTGTNTLYQLSNAFLNSAGDFKYSNTNFATQYTQFNGGHYWYSAPSGTAGNTITFTQAMTLDASGNLLVGLTSGGNSTVKKSVTENAGEGVFTISSQTGFNVIVLGTTGTGYSVANTTMFVKKDTGTNRSINAAGTINASGADYAEYMTKAGNFTVAKGDVVGIDAQGKLTNVFADAVSFMVKSTDPSYVGGDSWGSEEVIGL